MSSSLLWLITELDESDIKDLWSEIPRIEGYNGSDWALFKVVRDDYYRYLLYGSTKFDIVIITWPPLSYTPFHDHPRNGCIVRVMEGELAEETPFGVTNLPVGSITFRRGNEIHRMCNKGRVVAVSLHVYSPGGYTPKYIKISPNKK